MRAKRFNWVFSKKAGNMVLYIKFQILCTFDVSEHAELCLITNN